MKFVVLVFALLSFGGLTACEPGGGGDVTVSGGDGGGGGGGGGC